MTTELRDALLRSETDVAAVLQRFSGDEALYVRCLELFLQDQSMADLARALDAGDWDAAFTAAHALKGVAGNMGFIPLFHAAAALVILIRTGRTDEVNDAYRTLLQCYDGISAVIRQHCGTVATD